MHGFSEALTAVMTGATRNQLRGWRRTHLLEPEHHESRPPLYSFRDLVALRTIVWLRSETSLQKVRKALAALDVLELTEHPSAYKLTATDDKSIVVQLPNGSTIDLVRRPGQLMDATFVEVFRPFKNWQGEPVVDFKSPREHLEVDGRRLGGLPTIRGLRVRYDTVARLMEGDAVSPADVKRYFPGVSAAAARDAAWLDDRVRSA